MVHYKLLKIIFDTPKLIKVIIDVVIYHYSLLDLIVTNKNLFFTLKFWLLLYYFFCIKQKLSTALHPQINNQTEQQNCTIEAYF